MIMAARDLNAIEPRRATLILALVFYTTPHSKNEPRAFKHVIRGTYMHGSTAAKRAVTRRRAKITAFTECLEYRIQ